MHVICVPTVDELIGQITEYQGQACSEHMQIDVCRGLTFDTDRNGTREKGQQQQCRNMNQKDAMILYCLVFLDCRC